MKIGVGGAGDLAPRRVQQVVLPEAVPPGPQQGDQADEHGQVRLHLRGDPLRSRLGPDPPGDVVGARHHEGHDDQGGERPPVEELVEGEPEHVEADVPAEDRILHVERHGVQGQHEPVPHRGGADAEQECEKGAAARRDPPHVGERSAAVPVQGIVGIHREAVHRHQAGDDEEVGEAEEEEHDPQPQAQQHLGAKDRPEHRGEADLPVPLQVGVEADDRRDRENEEEKDSGESEGDASRTPPGRQALCHGRSAYSSAPTSVQVHPPCAGGATCPLGKDASRPSAPAFSRTV